MGCLAVIGVVLVSDLEFSFQFASGKIHTHQVIYVIILT
jgi:hypothetical protein